MGTRMNDHQDWHGDHAEAASPIHTDRAHLDRAHQDNSAAHAEAEAPLLPETSQVVLGYETLGTLRREELHEMLHYLGLQVAEPRLGLVAQPAEAGNPHWDYHNDQPERHVDTDHPHHHDWGQHWDHTDAHGDLHSDSGGSHGDHNDGAKPHVDTSGPHVDGPNHEDSHFDHIDDSRGHQDGSNHADHVDAHTDYHCDLHKDHGDHTDEPKFVDA